MGTGFGQPAPGTLVNPTLSDRLYWGLALATGAAGQTNFDLVAALAPGLLNGNGFGHQPEFVQRDAEHVGVCASHCLGLPVTYPAIASRRSRAECQS